MLSKAPLEQLTMVLVNKRLRECSNSLLLRLFFLSHCVNDEDSCGLVAVELLGHHLLIENGI